MKYIFFRNDDVRDSLDKSLVDLTALFTTHGVPISHTVEPANVSKEVIDWLISVKNETPRLIEIVQHGYGHRLNYRKIIGGKLKKGEFGGSRSYDEQFEEIKHGMELMNQFFGKQWFQLFTFPYGARNRQAIQAVSKAGFKVVNGSMGASLKHRTLYFIGRFLRKEMLWGRKISWHLRHKPKTKLFQIDTSISVIKKFNDEFVDAEFYTLEELQKQTLRYLSNEKTVGFVLHHRYHTSKEHLKLIEDLILWLKGFNNVEFVTQEFLYDKFRRR